MGADVLEFNPEHMALERVTSLPDGVYKPFGTGQRACIGRQFALQEAVLVLGMLVQRFDFIDHLDYELRTQTTLRSSPPTSASGCASGRTCTSSGRAGSRP